MSTIRNSRKVEWQRPFSVTPIFFSPLYFRPSPANICLPVDNPINTRRSWYSFPAGPESIPQRHFPRMLFDFDQPRSRIASRAVAPRTLEQKQRDVYDSHRHRIFSLSYYMTGSEVQAEEILRGAFIRAFRTAEEPDHAIVDAALLDQLREQQVLHDGDHLPPPSAAWLPPRHNILRTELEEAIRCLPSAERLVFLLTDVEGYPAPRVAELLRITESAARRAVLSARLRLRVELDAMRQDGCQAA